MPQVTLNSSDIDSFVNQSVSARVSEHVRVNIQMFQAGSLSNLTDHQPDCNPAQRPAPFADKKRVARLRRIQLRAFNKPRSYGHRFAVVEWMRTGIGTFKPSHMKFSRLQIYVAQLERA